MIVILPEQGMIKKQEIDLSNKVTIIYGHNNCGKTSVLRLINQFFDRRSIAGFFEKVSNEAFDNISLYIPTNRVVVSTRLTELQAFEDIENMINYKRELYAEYDLHLKMIRDYLLDFKIVRDMIKNAVSRMFDIDLDDFNARCSDGVENIINIYLNIIWILTWNVDFKRIEEDEFKKLLLKGSPYILIDEIEMFLHVNVQSNLIKNLTDDFPRCNFIFSTHSPLLLTRHKDAMIFRMESGILFQIPDDLFFKDLDIIYESYFNVKELPEQIGNDIRYLGEVVLGQEQADKEKIRDIVSNIYSKYHNLYHKYNTLIVKAKDRANI